MDTVDVAPWLLETPGYAAKKVCQTQAQNYRYQDKNKFELSRKGEQILKGGWPSSGNVKLGIAATVRYPGDRSMICVAFRE